MYAHCNIRYTIICYGEAAFDEACAKSDLVTCLNKTGAQKVEAFMILPPSFFQPLLLTKINLVDKINLIHNRISN
jgi:hypothetical protein